jgi:hypothetical protein
MPVSPQYDRVVLEHQSAVPVDRSTWRMEIFSQYPDIHATRVALNPLARAAAFLRRYLPTNRLISHDALLALISQHLHVIGFLNTQEALSKEFLSPAAFPSDREDSQLAFLIERAIARVDRFWDLTEGELTEALDEEISRVLGAPPPPFDDPSSLFSEAAGDPRFIKFEDDNPEPVEASLNQLIYWMTSSHPQRSTADLMSAVCLTLSSYCSSTQFFGKLKERWQMIVSRADSSDPTVQFELAFFATLYHVWSSGWIHDFEPQLAAEVMSFFNHELLPRHLGPRGKVFGPKSRLRAGSANDNSSSVDLGPCLEGLWTGEFHLLALPREELARQLTLWSSQRYCAIQRVELVDCAWEKPRLRYRAPNVTALTQHYNRVSRWVEYEVLSTAPLSARLQKMEQFVTLAQVLFDMNNYLDSMGVISGFEANSMFRLNSHFERLSPSAKENLNTLKTKCSSENNFKGLRVLFDQALRGGHAVVPYIGVLLSDLFKYYDATQTRVNGLINVRKCRGVYNLMTRIEDFMASRYPFDVIEQIQQKIEDLPDIQEDDLMAMSQRAEGDDGAIPDQA